MGAQLRVYRRRIRSVQSTKKITRAMELIAASRIVKAQQRVAAAQPYADAITRAVSAVASQSSSDHPLTTTHENATRAAMLIITSDRGLAGAYNANALRAGEELAALLRSEGKEPVPFLIGRKSIGYYKFRGREVAASWSGFSEQPTYPDAKTAADALIEAFLAPADEGGVDEIHIVYTEYVSALTQRATARRILPLVVEETDEPAPDGPLPLYEFEPSAEGVLDALLPRYVESRIYAALLQSAASESASRRRAMKSASDNAEELVKTLTRLANQARQAEITQEISEIVGGADALAANGSDKR
ncbi:MAG: F-type H+-transporting ATPase subunit gamma [Frankiaceae bacterium]|jgi:F-type H+-transporting ATPase subunit gamma|nr:F-type H+-transporting ATPase subunit gamma [Frankiaceae bacterium]MDX6274652.1 F-type H+-transporting ATPase subunit gamma [Frankiales bacterium]